MQTMKNLPQITNIMLLGSGGRECAFARSMSQSQRLGKLFIAPGNAGTGEYGQNVEVDPCDFPSVERFVLENDVHLIVVGPEEPLVRGIRDYFVGSSVSSHIKVLGPSAAAAAMEGSKSFSKDFMQKFSIPTAGYLEVSSENIAEGEAFLESLKPPYVLKADGLAAGKGVLILDDIAEAKRELSEMILGAKFGAASARVVIEEYLSGIECSVFVATDSRSYQVLPEAKDYKRIGEGDTGLNTGGMGAVSPVPFADAEFMEKVRTRIIEPTVKGIESEGLDYCGFIFIGLMNCGGEPYVIEYNVRMGDPETEVVLPRIQSDIIDLFEGIVCGCIAEKTVEITPKTAVTVVCTAGGYPEDYKKGDVISGLVGGESSESIVFHAGTAVKDGSVVTNGGRVLAVTSVGDSIQQAVDMSYNTISVISFSGMYFRGDIGNDLMR